jgi:beta-glucosidase
VPQDIRWGRAYESYGEQTELVSELGAAYVRGLQGAALDAPTSVLATPKHFVGDGATSWGSATTNDYLIDQGVTEIDEETLRAVHLPPYEAVIDAGARSIMVSFSSWGGMRMHAQEYLITDVLKGELGFDGFVVSDWGGIDQISADRHANVVTGVNAGIDMVMVPYEYPTFIEDLTAAVGAGDVTPERIDDAVARILRVKFELGLFEHPLAERGLLEEVGSDEHRHLARRAVAASAALLKNEGALPIGDDADRILVAGRAADDIGLQCGGWTIRWQGAPGPITDGTTILEGLEARAGSASISHDPTGEGDTGSADVGIVVVGEEPYAEGVGDDADLTLSDAGLATIRQVRERTERLIVVLVTGRPLILGDALELADAVVVAWLPGSEGGGLADVLFGDVPFGGRLPYTWPSSVEQLPRGAGSGEPVFPYDFGLTVP